MLSRRHSSFLALGFTLIILLMVLSHFFGLFQMKHGLQNVHETVQFSEKNHDLIEQMYMASLQRSMLIYEMLLSDDVFEIDELHEAFSLQAATFANAREQFVSVNTDPTLNDLLAVQSKLIRKMLPNQERIYELLIREERERARALFQLGVLPLQQKILKLFDGMEAIHSRSAKQSFSQSSKANRKVLALTILIAMFSILLSVLLSFFVIRKQQESDRKLSYLATTDVLTALPNRIEFTNKIRKTISNRLSGPFAVIFFDIDYFKSINDNYGHEIGDKVLRYFSAKILQEIAEVDLLSRFGGDEFVLLLRSCKTVNRIQHFVADLSKLLDTSFMVNGKEIFMTASIGASIFPEHGRAPEELLKHADMAMYHAKESGRNCYRFYSQDISDKMFKEHSLSHALHTVLKNNNAQGELFLNYQPLLNIESGDFNECEALIGWETSDGVRIPADDFIPIAEQSNLIEKINLFVINQACRQQAIWHKAGIRNVRININLSGNKRIFTTLLEQFRDNLKTLNLSPTMFGIELTERTLNEISDSTIEELELMKNQGVKIAIDDFGKDYSSLSYLKKLPITTLKIDKDFIAGLPNDKDDEAVIKTIITLAHSLKLDVVAEGVETREQLEFLKKHACNTVQGYFFHQPLSWEQISELKRVA